jgi:hypothetical protein
MPGLGISGVVSALLHENRCKTIKITREIVRTFLKEKTIAVKY